MLSPGSGISWAVQTAVLPKTAVCFYTAGNKVSCRIKTDVNAYSRERKKLPVGSRARRGVCALRTLLYTIGTFVSYRRCARSSSPLLAERYAGAMSNTVFAPVCPS